MLLKLALLVCLYPWLNSTSDFLKVNHIKPSGPVVVAVVDTGFDTTHTELSGRLWTNMAEIPGDGKDNDGNGYADDIHGWNFLGSADGTDIESNGTAEYREFKRLRPIYRDADTSALSPAGKLEYRHYLEMAAAAKIPSLIKYKSMLEIQVGEMENNPDPDMDAYLDYFRAKLEDTAAKVAQLDADDDVHRKAGNDPDDFSGFLYGNNHIGVNPMHGTMVAGLIAMSAAQCGTEVELMLLRAVPERGDEYDRDVAASIRYAVDNGAEIINLSLGKGFSPHPEEVAEAIRYAAAHDVLVLQAAGNNGNDNDAKPSWPGTYAPDGSKHRNMLVVGSCDNEGNTASFSNYGRKSVDIYAPGCDITSSAPGNAYETAEGTSLSAPAVAAVAAVMKACRPGITAEKLAETLRGTAEGGVLNACGAVKSAIGPFVDWTKVRRFTSDSLYRLARNSYCSVKWGKAGRRDVAVWDIKNAGGETEYHYFIPGRMKQERLMFSSSSIFPILAEADSAKAAKADPRNVNIHPEFETEDIISCEWGAKTVRYSLSKHKVLSVKDTPESRRSSFGNRDDYWKRWSSDSCFYIYSKNHDLYLGKKANADSVRLSGDGELYNSFSVSGARPDNDFSKPGYAKGSWIGKTHSYFVLREDTRRVGTMSVINSLSEPRPTVKTYKYALSGDKEVPQYECFIIDADKAVATRVDADKWQDQKLIIPKYSGVRTSSDAAWVLRTNRALDTLELCRIDAATAELKVIIAEECKPHYNETLFDYHLLNDGADILWWSERDGKGAWYLYDGNGKLKSRVSKGDFVAGAISRIDTTGRSIIYCGYGWDRDANPELDYYFRSDFDGRKTVCLTPGNGHHTITLSESGKYLTDTWSRIDAAPQTCISDLEGNGLTGVCTTDLTEVYGMGWKEPELVRVKAADGVTDLWGVVYLPADPEPGRKYPVISHVYPGPQTDLLPKAFAFDDDGNHSMAQMGCVVINFMHRGCNPWMGREFSNYGYGNLRDYPIDDDKAIIEQLAEMYPCIDLDKVGIFGHSGGGFMAATALMTYPDFYKVAVAASGNYDNNIYTILWGEVYHGLDRVPTTMELAPRLKGRLLLVTGDVDNNVNPASTMRMADALIKAGKSFDMLVIPGADHEVGNDYYEKTVRNYFLEHLLGVETNGSCE